MLVITRGNTLMHLIWFLIGWLRLEHPIEKTPAACSSKASPECLIASEVPQAVVMLKPSGEVTWGMIRNWSEHGCIFRYSILKQRKTTQNHRKMVVLDEIYCDGIHPLVSPTWLLNHESWPFMEWLSIQGKWHMRLPTYLCQITGAIGLWLMKCPPKQKEWFDFANTGLGTRFLRVAPPDLERKNWHRETAILALFSSCWHMQSMGWASQHIISAICWIGTRK